MPSTIPCDLRTNSSGAYLLDTDWRRRHHIHIKHNDNSQSIYEVNSYYDIKTKPCGLLLLKVYRDARAQKLVAITNENIILLLRAVGVATE